MIVRLSDGTEVEVTAERDEIDVRMHPPGLTWGVHALLDIPSCEQLLRGMQAELRKAEDW